MALSVAVASGITAVAAGLPCIVGAAVVCKAAFWINAVLVLLTCVMSAAICHLPAAGHHSIPKVYLSLLGLQEIDSLHWQHSFACWLTHAHVVPCLLRHSLQAMTEKLEEVEERARELYDCNQRLEAHVHDLESRKRAPLYQKKQVRKHREQQLQLLCCTPAVIMVRV